MSKTRKIVTPKAVKRNMRHIRYETKADAVGTMSESYSVFINSETVTSCFIDSCTRNGIVYLEELVEFPCMRNCSKQTYEIPCFNPSLYPWAIPAVISNIRQPEVLPDYSSGSNEEYYPEFLLKKGVSK